MASSSSSSSTQWNWDVFLSFRGEDTRRSFTDHLYSALKRCNIKTFRDDEGLRKGEEIAPELLQSIQESRIAVIVFSKTYAHSKWCLEELVEIINCKEKNEQKVIPIFYHVDPSDVRNQRGIYKEAFAHHEKNANKEKKEKIRVWKTALTVAGNLSGYDVKDSYETEIIHDVIKEIREFIPMVVDVNENIVGMDSRLERLISGLEIQSNAVRMVGVSGLGGIGKTTIITALYNKISNKFRSISFLTNIREESTKDSGILKLQQQLLDDTLGVKGQLFLKNIHEGVKVIKDKLSSERVLIFLDDIDNLRQLEHLVGQHAWFGPGSRIVITTRRKDLLTAHGVDYMYEADLLNDDEALQLFCCYAFKQHLPEKGFRDLSIHVLGYAAGLPLALKVLGSLFRKRERPYWKSELQKLKNMPNMDIVNVLKLSYDGLDDQQKMIFLDIACFFKGNDVQRVMRILDGSGFIAESGINALVDRCLITISRNMIEMHDLLMQMGRGIIDKECPNEPGERSRLWRHEDVYRVLERNTGTEKIEGIFLQDYTSKERQFTSEAFKRMTRLRWLIVFHNYVQLSEDFAFPSDDLICLCWEGYSLPSLPSNFHANSLVELNLNNSNIKRLWNANMCLNILRRIDLSGSEKLIEVPEFSTVPKLEDLILSGCVGLESLPGDIHKLKHLLNVRCNGCSKLASFPEIKRNIGTDVKLILDETAIKELPSSIERLKGLHCLSLNNCKNLESLPESICNLRCLKVLTLDRCSKLGKLPEGLERLPRLEVLSLNSLSCPLPSLSGLSLLRRLRLDECDLTSGVIKSDNCLKALKELSLRTCNLNEGEALNPIFHLSSLEILNLSKCYPAEGGNLSDIVVGISQLSNLRALYLSHCNKLCEIPELPSSLRLLDAQHSFGTSLPPMHSLVKCLESANRDLKYKRTPNEVLFSDSHYIGHGICIVVPGIGGIPKWIRNQNEVPQIRIQLPQNWYGNDDFLGIAICYVCVPLDGSEGIPKIDSAHSSEIESDDGSTHESDNEFGEERTGNLPEVESPISTDLVCQLTIDDGYGTSQFVQDFRFRTNCLCYRYGDVSEQMWMTLYPKVAILERCQSNQFTVLQAAFLYSYNDFKVLKCGLQPMYAYDPKIQTNGVDGTSCLECQKNVEYRKLCLRGQTINQLSIDWAVDTLCLRDCKNLESLPTSIWELKSLKSLFCSNCSQLQNLPEILQNMENMRELHLNGTAIKELPSSVVQLSRLQVLNLTNCKNLETLPESLCNLFFLEVLEVCNCSKLGRLPQNLGMLQSLKVLITRGLNSMCCQSLSLSGLCTLKSLFLAESMLVQGVILSQIFCLSSLEVLDLCHCNIGEGGIPSEMWHLSSLKQLLLRGNGVRTIPTGINQLSTLRLLDLSHCPRLQKIPKLPSSLRILDVHGCRLLETSSGLLWSSVFKCFKSLIQDLESGFHAGQKRFSQGVSVIISGNCGIPNWISHKKMGAEVEAKLPQDWHKSGDLLGFVLYSIYDPLDNESEAGEEIQETYFKYDLTLLGGGRQLVDDLLIYFQVNCNDDVPKMWMVYYPKVAIKKQYHSNKWRQLKASFCGYFCGKALKVKECGIHFIYSNDHDQEEFGNPGKVMIPTICQECQQDEESQLKLCANGDGKNELLTTEYSLQSDSLCFRGCKNLRSIPSRICEVKSLKTLFCSGCSQLRSFPGIVEGMENLKQLHLDGTAIEELPSSIQHLQGLLLLNLNDCSNLVRLPESICKLKFLKALSCSGCSNLRMFPEISENMENLEFRNLSETSIQELPSSIEHLRQLQFLYLKNCSNIVNIPDSICKLTSLEGLYLDFCTSLEKFPENLESLQCLAALGVKGLNLSKACLSSIPANIMKLSNLRVIDLSHCQNLLQVPDLPQTLRILDVHNCTCLETSSSVSTLLDLSLLSCFLFMNIECYLRGTFEQKCCNRAITVHIPGNNGIPEWVGQRRKGSQITVELPIDWNSNSDFLGFAVYSVFIPLSCGKLNCKLSFCSDGSDSWHVDDVWFVCCRICGESNQMCVAYYPKRAIKDHYQSNKWRRLKASFHSFDGEPVEVKECGYRLIYIPEDVGTDGHRIRDDTEGSAAEDAGTNAETSYHNSQFTERNSYPPMDTTTQNVGNNAVDTQYDEDDHQVYNWVELLRKFVRWIFRIFGRRY